MIGSILATLKSQHEAASGAFGALEALRAQIEEAKHEIDRISAAPQPLEDAMAAFDRWADAQATAAVDALPTARLLDRSEAGRGLDRERILLQHRGAEGGHVTVELGPEIDVLRGLLMVAPTIRGTCEHGTAWPWHSARPRPAAMVGAPMADPATITLAAFARLVGAARDEIDGLILSGVLPQPSGRDRRLPLREAAAAYLAHLRAHLATARAGASASRAQDARAEAAALDLAVERRELIDAEDVDSALTYVCGAINAAFQYVPIRATRDLSQRRPLAVAFHELPAELAAGLASDR